MDDGAWSRVHSLKTLKSLTIRNLTKLGQNVRKICSQVQYVDLLGPMCSDQDLVLLLRDIRSLRRINIDDREIDGICEALKPHFKTITEIRCVTLSSGFWSSVMSSCPNLVSVFAVCLSHEDILNDQSWKCSSLTRLSLMVQLPSTKIEETDVFGALCRRVSELRRLEHLFFSISGKRSLEEAKSHPGYLRMLSYGTRADRAIQCTRDSGDLNKC